MTEISGILAPVSSLRIGYGTSVLKYLSKSLWIWGRGGDCQIISSAFLGGYKIHKATLCITLRIAGSFRKSSSFMINFPINLAASKPRFRVVGPSKTLKLIYL